MTTPYEDYCARQGWASPSVVDPHEFATDLRQDDTVVVEICRTNDDSGYRQGHIPGARYVYWKDLAWALPRRDFPDATTMATRLGALGATPSTTIVVCGDPIQFGVYAAWAMEMCGHRNVKVLDGGKEYWTAAALPTTSETPQVQPVAYPPGISDQSSRIGRDEVLALLGREDVTLLDLRSREEFVGERVSASTSAFDHGAESKGHIPRARHLFFKNFLTLEGRFKDGSDLRKELAAVNVSPADRVVTYCRLGHRASFGRFVLTHLLGHENVRVYDGSWTEWGSMVGVPVAVGPEDPA